MLFLKKIFYSCCILWTLNSSALTLTDTPTLTLRIINHTNSTLIFSGITHMHPGNTFYLNIPEILPGGSTTLTASTSAFNGIMGALHFNDQKGNANLLEIFDPNQIDSKQYGKFVMNNNRFVSFVSHQTLNTSTDPHSLAWTSATIEIQNKLQATV